MQSEKKMRKRCSERDVLQGGAEYRRCNDLSSPDLFAQAS